jgi:hypothetical protein
MDQEKPRKNQGKEHINLLNHYLKLQMIRHKKNPELLPGLHTKNQPHF